MPEFDRAILGSADNDRQFRMKSNTTDVLRMSVQRLYAGLVLEKDRRGSEG
jgi:hypothetical protein